METKMSYFAVAGKANTDPTLALVRERCVELGIRQVIVASTHGYTALRAAEVLDGLDVEIIAVSICAAFDDVGWTMSREERARLEAAGITVLTSLHALGDDVGQAFGGAPANRVVREVLYCFCQGMKVAVEVAVMAADAGLLDISKEVLAVAGTGEGADTALVLKPAYARKFKELEVREILAKPRNAR